MIPEDGSLTNEEILSCLDEGETLTNEQMEVIKDFMALAAVIAYEGLLQENNRLN